MGSTKKKKRGNDNAKLIYIFAVAFIIIGIGFYLTKDKRGDLPPPPAPPPAPTERPTAPFKKETKFQPPEETVPAPLLPPPPSRPRLAVIIDDIGNNHRYKELVNIGVPITLAVMPSRTFSKEAATYAYRKGAEIILHLPMQPKGYPETDPGKGALLVQMTREQILGMLKKDIETVPHITGVNNHMGSQFTEFHTGMKVVLSDLKERGLFFIDSKTSLHSKAYTLARSMKVRSAERSVFLDNVQEEAAISRQLTEAVRVAKEMGEAIAIGHPYPSTVAVLEKMLPRLNDEGIELVRASALVR